MTNFNKKAFSSWYLVLKECNFEKTTHKYKHNAKISFNARHIHVGWHGIKCANK